jgi:hypothetical protein
MPTRARSRSSAIVVRSSVPARRAGPSPRLAKLESRLASVARRARDVSTETEAAIITVGVPTVMGLLASKGTFLPTFGGFHPMLVWGAPMALLGEKAFGGTWGKRVKAAGIGLLACAGNRAGATGSFKVEGDEETGADGDDDDD